MVPPLGCERRRERVRDHRVIRIRAGTQIDGVLECDDYQAIHDAFLGDRDSKVFSTGLGTLVNF